MANKDSHKALLNQLKDPFDPKLVKWRQGGGGTTLAYIDARDVMKRLDDVLGVAGWQTKQHEVTGGFICELGVKIDQEWIWKSNGANNTKIEPIKGGMSSAEKRAAVEWGIGRYLYYLPKWCNASNVEQWPDWAKPNSNIDNWEDIAQMEADLDTGIDTEVEGLVKKEIFELIAKITDTKDQKELAKLTKEFSAEEQLELADVINTKKRELLHADKLQPDTSKTPAA